MFSGTFLKFLLETNSFVGNTLFSASSCGTLAAEKCQEVDVNDKGELVYRRPGGSSRQIIRPGKLPALVTPTCAFDSTQLEVFTNIFKSYFTPQEDYSVKVVSGQDIIDSYRIRNYASVSDDDDDDNPLWKSCMNDDDHLLELYARNPEVCRLVRLIDNRDDRIAARALLWTTREGITLMDRVYAITPVLREKMLTWAEKNGHYRKQFQSYNSKTSLRTHQGEVVDQEVTVQLTVIPNKFPYLDTFTYLLPDKQLLTNQQPESDTWYYELDATSGGFSEHTPIELVESNYHGYAINRALAVYSDVVEDWINRSASVTLNGRVYPMNHPDLVNACVSIDGNINYGLRLASDCVCEDGLWIERGHPYYYQTETGNWVRDTQLRKYQRVLNWEQQPGLFVGRNQPLLPPDTELITDFRGSHFPKGDPGYGYYSMPDWYNDNGTMGVTGWIDHTTARYVGATPADPGAVAVTGEPQREQTPEPLPEPYRSQGFEQGEASRSDHPLPSSSIEEEPGFLGGFRLAGGDQAHIPIVDGLLAHMPLPATLEEARQQWEGQFEQTLRIAREMNMVMVANQTPRRGTPPGAQPGSNQHGMETQHIDSSRPEEYFTPPISRELVLGYRHEPSMIGELINRRWGAGPLPLLALFEGTSEGAIPVLPAVTNKPFSAEERLWLFELREGITRLEFSSWRNARNYEAALYHYYQHTVLVQRNPLTFSVWRRQFEQNNSPS